MSTRERWIVYPLLFLTLGIALRDKIIPPARLGSFGSKLEAGEIDAKLIRCGQSECRELIVTGPNGRPVIVAYADNKTHNGAIETLSAAGSPLILLRSSDAGGIVVTLNQTGGVTRILGDVGVPPTNRVKPEPPSPEQPPENEKSSPSADKRNQ